MREIRAVEQAYDTLEDVYTVRSPSRDETTRRRGWLFTQSKKKGGDSKLQIRFKQMDMASLNPAKLAVSRKSFVLNVVFMLFVFPCECNEERQRNINVAHQFSVYQTGECVHSGT